MRILYVQLFTLSLMRQLDMTTILLTGPLNQTSVNHYWFSFRLLNARSEVSWMPRKMADNSFVRSLTLLLAFYHHFISVYGKSLLCDFQVSQLIRLPYFTCANSDRSGETARMCRLAWAFAGAYVISTIISWAGSNYLRRITAKPTKWPLCPEQFRLCKQASWLKCSYEFLVPCLPIEQTAKSLISGLFECAG